MRYRSKIGAVTGHAIEFTRQNIDEFKRFVGQRLIMIEPPKSPNGKYSAMIRKYSTSTDLVVSVDEGDYVFKTQTGSIRVMTKTDFFTRYEAIKED